MGLSTRMAEKEASRAEVETHKETHKHTVSSATSTIEELMSLKRASNEQN